MFVKVGKLCKVFINYCQYFLCYQCYFDGENFNIFNLVFFNGLIMDIGFYCLVFVVVLWGELWVVFVIVSLLDSGVDVQGIVVLSYGDFDVMLYYFKVSDFVIFSEIQGEDGVLVIEKIFECQKLVFVLCGGKVQDLMQFQYINIMLYEVEIFVCLVEIQDVDYLGLVVSWIIVKLFSEICCQIGVIFLVDMQLLV